MTGLKDRHRRIIHTAFSILTKGLSPEGLSVEVAPAQPSELDRVKAAAPPPLSAREAPLVAGLAESPPKPSQVRQSVLGSPSALRFFRGLPWAGRLLAVDAPFSQFENASREAATQSSAQPEVASVNPLAADTVLANELSVAEVTPLASSLQASLEPRVSALRFFHGLPWAGATEVWRSPVSRFAGVSRELATPEPTSLDGSENSFPAPGASSVSGLLEPVPAVLASHFATNSREIATPEQASLDEPEKSWSADGVLSVAGLPAPVPLASELAGLPAARFFRALPWAGVAEVWPAENLHFAYESWAEATPDAANEELAWAKPTQTEVDAVSQHDVGSGFANRHQDLAAAFFRNLPWVAPKSEVSRPAEPIQGIGLGGAIMAAATRSALMAAARERQASTKPAANTYFKTLPWRGNPPAQAVRPLL